VPVAEEAPRADRRRSAAGAALRQRRHDDGQGGELLVGRFPADDREKGS
jgi:hypothetical protein